jgi:RND family efflux transporter MFP subunit
MGVAALLAACSSGTPDTESQPVIAVQIAMPKMETFHLRITAFGQLAAERSGVRSLSLPQPGEVGAIRVVAGQRVQRGEALLEFTTDPSARAAYLQARSALKVALAERARSERLHVEKLATNAQLDAARKTVSDARAALSAQGELGGAQAVTLLRAPGDGVVTALEVQQGQRVAGGAALIRFTPASSLVAQLGVDPAAAAELDAGMPVTLEPVYAAAGAAPLHGTVAMVGNAVDPRTHMVAVVASLDAPASLPAGAALSGTIAAAAFEAWAVPRAALQSDDRGAFVYQVEHGKAERVDVAVVAPVGSPVGVRGPLDPHAPVITVGSYEVSGGAAVATDKAAEP